jgi:hypothetical protein
MRTASEQAGVRLVDDMDVHWYPEATGGGVRVTGTDTSAAVAAARVQAPRSLWDPSYRENSWITNDYLNGPIRLIPRLRERIAANYPGTGVAVTEWNFGGGQHISGALASADVLGVFGRQGVSKATFWELNPNESFSYAAFKAFRNFDGQGGRFGDTSVQATSSDNATATVYASIDSADHSKAVIVAINKSTSAQTASIALTAPWQYTGSRVYTVTAAGGPQPVPAGTLAPVARNAWNFTMPASSIVVIVPTR